MLTRQCLLRTPLYACVLAAACHAGAVDPTAQDGPPSAGAWNQWRGAHRNGVVRNSPPLIDALPDGGLAPAWTWTPSESALQKGWATSLIVGQRVYVLAHDGAESGMPATTESVVCLDLASGDVIWKCATPSVETEFPISNTPVIDGDRLYYFGGASQVRCVDCRTGKKLWSHQFPRSADREKSEERPRGGTFEKMNSQSSLLVVGDMLIVSAAGDGVAGLKASTGEVAWNTETQAEPRGTYWLYATWKFSSPVVWKSEEGKAYVLTSEAIGLTCRDPASGSYVWHLPHRCGAYATPVVVGNQLVMVSEEGLHGYTLSLQSPEQKWHVESVHSWDRGDYGMPSPLIVNGHVYTLDQRGVLTCVDVESGQVQWSEKIPLGKSWSCPIAADGKMFWCFGEAGLYCLKPSPERFHALFAAKRDKAHRMMSVEPRKRGKGDGFNGVSSPSICQGRLIIRGRHGVLLCYDLRR